MKRCIVITTILPPSPQLLDHCRRGLQDGTDVIVVADRKTPTADYESLATEFSNLHVLSLDRQHDLFPRLSSALPFNHYARKNIGYAYAIGQGHEAIFDTDDDNATTAEWQRPAPGERRLRVRPRQAAGITFFNVYSLYTSMSLWPRGFPLDRLRGGSADCDVVDDDQHSRIAVWQGLVDGDPDVDAIARLTAQDGGNQFRFETAALRVALDRGVICPINSQNTWWIDPAAFDLLFLPATTTFRTCDILRGYVAQQVLWGRGATVGFAHATAVQARNPHDLMADFASELPLYLHAVRMNEVLHQASPRYQGGPGDLVAAYAALADAGFVDRLEIAIAEAWVNSCARG